MRGIPWLRTRQNVVLIGSAVAVTAVTTMIGVAVVAGDDSPHQEPTESVTSQAYPTEEPRTRSPEESRAFPSAETVGVPNGTALTLSGDLTITTPGTVIEGLDVDGVIQVKADDVVIRASRIRGSGWWSVDVAEGLTGVVVENCDIDGQGEQGTENSMGVMGPATVRGNDISGVENGVTPGTGSVIEGNYIHGLLAPGEPHYDGIQIDGNVSDIVIRNNTITVDHGQTSAVMIANDMGPATDISVEGNYLAGGAYTVYADAQFDGGPISGVRFVDNTLEPGQYGYASIEGNVPEISGNVDAETGKAVPLTSGQ